MQKTDLYNEGYYHVFNRGVDKRSIFLDNDDHSKFLSGINEFRWSIEKAGNESKRLVKLMAFCLMENHYHLFVQQISDNGLSKFMQRLGTGYTMYFNKKYERTGSLFENRYKSVEIRHQSQFEHITRYIHLNPAEILYPNWKRSGVLEMGKLQKFLFNYPWSSYSSYVHKFIKFAFLDVELINQIRGNALMHEEFVFDWVKHFKVEPRRLSLD